MLFGCNQKEFDDPPSDSKVANEQKLSAIREITKNFIPNPDSAKFRNQIGDCGEVSYAIWKSLTPTVLIVDLL